MSAFLSWYFAVQLMAGAALPLSWWWLGRLPDRGYAASKILGILLATVILWLGNVFDWLPNTGFGAAAAFGSVVTLSWMVLRAATPEGSPLGGELLIWLREHRLLVLWCEVLFLVAFGGLALLRAHDPAIDHTEQPMDFMMLQALQVSPRFPPQDPWLSGFPISYYYLGYWMVVTLGRLAQVPTEVAYNLAVACWFGLLVLGSFGLGFDLLSLDARAERGVGARALYGGTLCATGVALISNVRGTVDAFGRLLAGPATGWWWWGASRVLADRDALGRPVELIDEFPAFSFVLGDLHPHLLAAPLILLTALAALCLVLVQRSRSSSEATGTTAAPGAGIDLGAVGANLVRPEFWLLTVVVGASLATNTWDFPAHVGLVVLAGLVALSPAPESGARSALRLWVRSVRFAVLLALGALVVYAPFALTAQSMASGLLPNLFSPTRLSSLLAHFGQFVPGLGLLLVLAWPRRGIAWRAVARRGLVLLAATLLVVGLGGVWAAATDGGRQWLARTDRAAPPSALLGSILLRIAHGSPTLLALVAFLALVWTLSLHQRRSQPGSERDLDASRRAAGATQIGASDRTIPVSLSFTLLLAGLGAALVLIPELVYLGDQFANRMNTVFKLYYPAWLLLALAASYGIVAGLGPATTHPSSAGAGAVRRALWIRRASRLSLALLLLGTLYPILAALSKAQASSGPLTLDGLARLRLLAPDELAAIRWVRGHVPPSARIVEAVGESYRSERNRLSAATGRATLLGWVGHELQWRGAAFEGMAGGRSEAVASIYRAPSVTQLEEDLRRWQVDYVYLGPMEREIYAVGPAEEELLRRGLEVVFESGQVALFRRHGVEPEEDWR